MSNEPFEYFVGIDWATQAHQVCIVDTKGTQIANFGIEHSGRGLADLVDQLTDLSDGHPERIAVSIEIPHGPVVESLLERGFAVHAINPKQLDRFRDRFSVAGAKDDRLDALVLAHSLLTDRQRFRLVVANDPWTIQLREWSRMLDDLKRERVLLCNRLREQLRRYYVQFLDLGDDPGEAWLLDLWELLPTPDAASRATPAKLRRVLQKRRIRRIDAKEVASILRQPSLRVAPGTTEAAVSHIKLLAPRLRLVQTQIRDCERQIDGLLADNTGEETEKGQPSPQRDADILRSMPGIGRVVLATLLGEARQPLGDRDYHTLRALCGVAPITRRSGKSCQVVMRKACNPRLRNATYHWARVASQNDPLCRARYAALRARGHSHGRALRGISDRLLLVACAALRNGQTYRLPERSHPPCTIKVAA